MYDDLLEWHVHIYLMSRSTCRFWFGYQVDRFGDYMDPLYPQNFTKEEIEERKKFKYEAERPGNRFPYDTPFGPGSLFAIRADEFWRLGGYDEGKTIVYLYRMFVYNYFLIQLYYVYVSLSRSVRMGGRKYRISL